MAPGLVLAGVLVWAGILTAQVLSAAGQEPAERADVIIVLGCAVWPNEQPSPSLAARTREGIRLYQEGAAPVVILAGGVGEWPPAEAEVMRRLMVEAGVPESALLLDSEAINTEQSLQNARPVMESHGWHSAILVSDPFHLYRAVLMAGDEGIDASGAPASDSPTWTRLRLRAYYTAREVVALMAYTLLHPLRLSVPLSQAVTDLRS